MMRLHLIADDLTGALDTAAQFVGATGSIPVHWRGLPRLAIVSSIAIDSGTREAGREEARETVAALAAGLPRNPDAISYAKLDSLLRGHAGAEIAGWIAALKPDHCIVAPAFPFQGRITRDGRQLFRTGDGWQPGATTCAPIWSARDWPSAPAAPAIRCRPVSVCGMPKRTPTSPPSPRPVARSTAPSCGAAAAALAGALAQTAGQPSGHGGDVVLPRPVMGSFGTNHPVMTAQLAACGSLAMDPAGRWRRERRRPVPPAARRAGHRPGRVVAARTGCPAPRPPVGIDHESQIARPSAGSARHSARRRWRNAAGALSGAGSGTARPRRPYPARGPPLGPVRGALATASGVISKSGAFGERTLLRGLLGLDTPFQQGDQT